MLRLYIYYSLSPLCFKIVTVGSIRKEVQTSPIILYTVQYRSIIMSSAGSAEVKHYIFITLHLFLI